MELHRIDFAIDRSLEFKKAAAKELKHSNFREAGIKMLHAITELVNARVLITGETRLPVSVSNVIWEKHIIENVKIDAAFKDFIKSRIGTWVEYDNDLKIFDICSVEELEDDYRNILDIYEKTSDFTEYEQKRLYLCRETVSKDGSHKLEAVKAINKSNIDDVLYTVVQILEGERLLKDDMCITGKAAMMLNGYSVGDIHTIKVITDNHLLAEVTSEIYTNKYGYAGTLLDDSMSRSAACTCGMAFRRINWKAYNGFRVSYLDPLGIVCSDMILLRTQPENIEDIQLLVDSKNFSVNAICDSISEMYGTQVATSYTPIVKAFVDKDTAKVKELLRDLFEYTEDQYAYVTDVLKEYGITKDVDAFLHDVKSILPSVVLSASGDAKKVVMEWVPKYIHMMNKTFCDMYVKTFEEWEAERRK